MTDKLGTKRGFQPIAYVDESGISYGIKNTNGQVHITTFDTEGREGTILIDEYGFQVENTPMGEIRTATPNRLVGSNFIGTTLDTNFWTKAEVGTGTVSQLNGEIVLATGTTANSSCSISSVRYARYTGGSALRYRAVVQLEDSETGVADNIRRWGAYDANNGAFFELNGTTLNVVTRKGGSDTAVPSSSWNGASFSIDNDVHTYEIYWTNSTVWFVVSDQVVHTVSATSTTWSATTTLPIKAENVNTNGLDTNIELAIRVQTIYRLGELETQPISKYQSGTTAGLVLKYGPGNLHGAVISGVAQNSAVTLYDNTAASGTVIWESGTMGAQTQPFGLDFHSLPFSTGLTLVIAAAASNITVIYE